MADNMHNVEYEQDLELVSNRDAKGFDNLLADEVVVEWLMQLEQEQHLHAAAG